MSARDEQPATVPPPPGEDDAYSAATKVGVMPAEVLARLRAEGLLPEEEERLIPPPAADVSPSSAHVPPSAAPDDGVLPLLYSTVPPAPPPASEPEPLSHPGPISVSRSQAPPLPRIHLQTPATEMKPKVAPDAQTAPPSVDAAAQMETPVAFASPPITPSFGPPQDAHLANVPGNDDSALRQEIRAFGGGRLWTSRVLGLLIAGVLLLVVVAFAMALSSQRR